MTTPRGVANSDYSTPCPGCHLPPRRGERVIKIVLPKSSRWWHETCRKQRLMELCTQD